MRPDFEPIEIFFNYDAHDSWRELSIEKYKVRNDILLTFQAMTICSPIELKIPPLHIVANVCDTESMRELIAQYESLPIQMDWFTGKCEQPSFSVYTCSERQNKLTNELDKLINHINQLRDMGLEIYITQLIESMQGAIYFDLDSQTLDVNHKFILKCQ
jgi:hypothetical protein